MISFSDRIASVSRSIKIGFRAKKWPIVQTAIYIGFFLLAIYFFASNEIYINSRTDINTDPINTYRSFFYMWNDGFFLGQSYAWVVSYIFPHAFFYAFFQAIFQSIYISQALTFATFLFMGFVSFSLFVRSEFKTNDPIIFLVSFFYACNIFVALHISSGYLSLLTAYFAMPLQLFCLRKILEFTKYFRFSILFSLATLFMSGINPPFIAINLIVIFVYLIHVSRDLNHKLLTTRNLKRLGITFILTLTVNLYWIFPLLLYFLQSASFGELLSEPLTMHNRTSSYLNVFRTLGLWSFGAEYKSVPYDDYSGLFLHNPFWIFSMFLFPLIVLGLSLFSQKQLRQKIWLYILIVIAIPVAVGIYQPPFAGIYQWSYDHVPLFSMFRSSYKLVQIYIFALATLLATHLLQLSNRKKPFFIILLSILFVVNAFPFFTKTVIQQDNRIKTVPDYYFDAAAFFKKDVDNYRIFTLPMQYFSVYTWGNTKSNIEYIFKKGLVTRMPGTEYTPSNAIYIRLHDFLVNHQYVEAEDLFRELNIKYILQRNDIDWEYYSNLSLPPEQIRGILAPYRKVASFGALDVYEVPNFVDGYVQGKNLSFVRVSSVEYRVLLKNPSPDENIVFLNSFDRGWKLYLDQSQRQSSFFFGLLYLFRKPIADDSHAVVYGYANQWTVDTRSIIQTEGATRDLRNASNTEVYLTIYYQPQVFFVISLLVTIIGLLFSAIWLIVQIVKARRL